MVILEDVERAIAVRDPELGALVVRYLAQDDPDDGRGELAPSAPDDDHGDDDHGDDAGDDAVAHVPAGAYTIDRLSAAVAAGGLAHQTPTERKLARLAAFAAAMTSPFAPPRLRLGKLLIELYERGEPEGRAALLEIFATGTMKWGVWQAAKAIYKRAEERHDAALWGVLAFRFDAMRATPHAASELGAGTLLYLRRRAWRYLRLLGQAVPDAYPVFAVEVLRHYPASHQKYTASWVAAQIWNHGALKGARGSSVFGWPGRGDPLAKRAFPAAWKLAPAPLLRLLEAARNDLVCEWAIASLRADHPLALRAVEPAWLARLGRRPVPAIHGFVVALLRESPELHQSRLRALGLHDVVLGFLRSASSDARAYALDYAAAHAPDLAIDELVELVEAGAEEVARFAAARLEAMPARQLGVRVVLRLLARPAAPWAAHKLAQGFAPTDIDAAAFVDTAARGADPFNALLKLWNDQRVAIPAAYWTALLDDPRFGPEAYQLRRITTVALGELAKRTAREIGVAWIQKSLEDRARTDAVSRWLDAGMLSGDELDVAWLKGLVGKPRLRPIALKLLADRRRVAPARIGLAWLLDLMRSSDAELAQFAQRMLLESFEPGDFTAGDSAGGADQDASAGVARLWQLAAGARSPEAVRGFAATYLKAHHPALGPRLAEAKALGIQPRLGHAAYPLATVRPLLGDPRADVRRLAVAIAGEELVAWDDPALVYELAGAPFKEPRGLGVELLMGLISSSATPGDARRLPAAWLDGRQLFQLAESPHKATREVALTLIRHLYDRVGGAERLTWLMDSPERDVRLFAVRLFWDRHRPKPWPAGFVPRKPIGAPGSAVVGTERFADVPALQQFARTVLFGLPPGRIGERDPVGEGAPRPERALPASVAKKRMIEALRDVALEDVELARAVVPVLREMTASLAKGEWQASVQALTSLRAHHAEAL
ncbi:MAG TPA: hypothetical protein VFP84_23055 [Kofleriaceae bacterium]|nr:hypothetical protein [Kofleriaceae bacterium]